MEIEPNKQKALKFKEEGNVHFKSQNFAKALELYQKAIQQDPTEATFYQNKAACYLNMKRYLKCVEECKIAISKDANCFKAYRFMAQSYLNLGKIQEAREASQQAIKINSADQQVCNISDSAKLAEQKLNQYKDLSARNEFEEAFKCVDYLKEKCPDSEEFNLLYAEGLIKSGKIDKAKQHIRSQYISDDYLKALVEFYDQKGDQAIKIINQSGNRGDQKLVQLKEIIQKSDQLKAKGNEALKAQNWPNAIKFYNECLQLDAGNNNYNSIINSNLGLVYMKQDKLKEALECMNKSIKQNPNYFKAFLRRGEIYNKQGKYEQAIQDYQKVQEIDSSQDMTSYVKAAQAKVKKEKKDYYQILGVSKQATADEIKKAYKKKALQWHPDRHRSKSEEEQEQAKITFKTINEAFNVLSDEQKRALYDRGGEEALNGGGGFPGGGMGNAEDIFKMFSGMGGGGMGGGFDFGGDDMGGGFGGFPGGMFMNMGGMGGGMGGGSRGRQQRQGGGNPFGGMGGGGMGGIDLSDLLGGMMGGGMGGGMGGQQRRSQRR